MKKFISYGVLLLLLVPALSYASFDISLKYGSSGTAVSSLQDFLKDQGDYKGIIDGQFGLGTLKAVESFQKANNLKVDGIFGKVSQAMANTIFAIPKVTSPSVSVVIPSPEVLQTPVSTQPIVPVESPSQIYQQQQNAQMEANIAQQEIQQETTTTQSNPVTPVKIPTSGPSQTRMVLTMPTTNEYWNQSFSLPLAVYDANGNIVTDTEVIVTVNGQQSIVYNSTSINVTLPLGIYTFTVYIPSLGLSGDYTMVNMAGN